MRTVKTDLIIETIREMCIKANIYPAADVKGALYSAYDSEESPLGRKILGQLRENLDIASAESIPICQDTGMAIVFVKLGQDVHIEGGSFNEAVNEGVRRGYAEGYLRKSVVSDPLLRKNTNDNTPAIIHVEIVDGENIEFTVAPKGFGSENMSKLYMLKPADGEEGVKKAVVQAVKEAGPNACPPVVVGVGIGGDFEKAAILAKKALTRNLDKSANDNSEKDPVSGMTRPEYAARLEKELFDEINALGIGPGGMGGKNTCLGVNVETYPTHIAGLPVAVNICCHVNRHVKVTV